MGCCSSTDQNTEQEAEPEKDLGPPNPTKEGDIVSLIEDEEAKYVVLQQHDDSKNKYWMFNLESNTHECKSNFLLLSFQTKKKANIFFPNNIYFRYLSHQ